MDPELTVTEIFLSIQGEGTHAGLPCIFIRLTGCPLRCSYCDTAYAFNEGTGKAISDILAEVDRLADGFPMRAHLHAKWPLVEVTGGEPLAQTNTPILLSKLCDLGYTVLLETSGALSLRKVDRRVIKIMDIKCPSSGEADRFDPDNLGFLIPGQDEIKFVIQTREDYRWAKAYLLEKQLYERFVVLFSPASAPTHAIEKLKPAPLPEERISPQWLADQILLDKLPVRLQLQLHKILWPAEMRGR